MPLFTFKSRQERNPDSWSISHFIQTPSIGVKMENIDEELKINICNILPSMSEEMVDGIIHALKYVGLEMMSDLKFVQEEDLILVLKPIQRRKLVNAWREQNTSNSQIDEINKKVDQYVSSLRNEEWSRQSVSMTPSETENAPNSQTDEINKNGDKYVPSNGEWSRQSISTTPSPSETESIPPVILSNLPPKNVISSVNASGSLSEQNCNWNKKRTFQVLELYTKYKTEFSHPDIEEQTVWKKIAYRLRNCDELQCRNKIDELRREYERIRNKDVTSRETAIFLDEAKKAFETTKTTGKTNPLFFLNLKKSDKDFLSKLLQVYAKYKTELTCSNTEEQKVWEKIAKEMGDKFSYACGATLCRYELLHLKSQYESLKKDGVKNENVVYLFQDAKEAFESSEYLDTSNSQIDEINKNVDKCAQPHLRKGESMQSVSTISSETESIPPVKSSNLSSEKCKWNQNKCLVLLQVYQKYKTELSCSSIEEKREVWRKIAKEVRQKCSLKCNQLQCMDKIKDLNRQYYILKYNNKNELSQNMTVFFNELGNAFDKSKNRDNPNCQVNEIKKKVGIYVPPHLRNGENRQIESTVSSKTEIISPVGASSSLSVDWIKDMKKNIKLLRRYTKNKPELSHPGVEEQTVWKKIALSCDESQCHNKIEELRREYERIKNDDVTNRETAMFLDEAKRAFETTETTEQSRGKFSISLNKSNKDFLRKLLQVYTKYKTEIASPETEEENGWKKIAKEVTEISPYYCGARICCFELVQLKYQYENFKRTGVRNGDMAHFLDEAREAFEDSEKLGRTFTIKVRNLSEKVEKPDLQELFGHFGKIAHISDIKSSPGKSKRYFAFIKFQKEEDATRAIQVVNGYEYDKLILKVNWAETSQTNEVLE